MEREVAADKGLFFEVAVRKERETLRSLTLENLERIRVHEHPHFGP